MVYAKRPFGGPQAVLAYLSRYTHRVAIANSRLIACDRNGVTFRWKDYRAEGRDRQKTMTLATAEFIRKFLIHVLPHGFHRIRHYGLLASGTRADNIARAAPLARRIGGTARGRGYQRAEANEPKPLSHPCPCCGGRMIIIETFQRGCLAAQPSRGIPRRDQDRHIMIESVHGKFQGCTSARRLSTGNDHARPRAALDSRRVVRSPPRNADSALRSAERLVAPAVACRISSPTHPGNKPPASKSP